jgi:hypothetical protein
MARAPWKLKLRIGPRIVDERADTLPEALQDLRISLTAVAAEAPGEPASTVFREYEPVQQVIARGEIKGPGGVRAGIDVRGDGSSEAWTGRFSKAVVVQEPGEDAYQALERVLGDQ